jgi:hypothetical protein
VRSLQRQSQNIKFKTLKSKPWKTFLKKIFPNLSKNFNLKPRLRGFSKPLFRKRLFRKKPSQQNTVPQNAVLARDYFG